MKGNCKDLFQLHKLLFIILPTLSCCFRNKLKFYNNTKFDILYNVFFPKSSQQKHNSLRAFSIVNKMIKKILASKNTYEFINNRIMEVQTWSSRRSITCILDSNPSYGAIVKFYLFNNQWLSKTCKYLFKDKFLKIIFYSSLILFSVINI